MFLDELLQDLVYGDWSFFVLEVAIYAKTIDAIVLCLFYYVLVFSMPELFFKAVYLLTKSFWKNDLWV